MTSTSIITRITCAGLTLLATAACSSDPLSGPDTGELYTRQFIKDFGVPAAGHDYSMATSAGLRVTASRPTSVIVTAEVEGKEYLFANLTVSEGTTELPVTIPRSVSTLNIKTPAGHITAGVNDIVDLDAIQSPASRSVDFTKNMYGEFLFSYNFNDQPIITFKIGDFLKDFFKDNPQGQHNTNYQHTVWDGTYFPDEDSNTISNYSETVLRDAEGKADYYVFPIYWRVNKAGYKNYQVRGFNWNELFGFNPVEGYLFDPSTPTAARPFPQLYYSAESVDPDDVFGEDNALNPKFMTDNGSFTESYPVNSLSDDATVVSYGTRLKLPKNYSSLGFVLYCGNTSSPLRTYSSPAFNYYVWGENYYDESLTNLMYCYAGTKIYPFGEPDFYGIQAHKFDLITDRSTGSTQFVNEEHSKPFILGFDTPALSPAADRSTRDYSDVLLLFVPVGSGYVNYDYCYTDRYPAYDWVVACEDLGGSFDWDFNDAVFTFTDVIENLGSVNKNFTLTYTVAPLDAVNVRKITVKPLAAGGTMPLYITYTGINLGQFPDMPSEGDILYSEANGRLKDAVKEVTDNTIKTYIVGTELHKWLGGSTHANPINVGAKHSDRGAEEVQFMIPTDYQPFVSQYLNYHGVSSTNSPLQDVEGVALGGFALLVDKDNTLGIDARNDVDKGIVHCPDHFIGATYFIGAPNEDKGDVAPQMLVVPGDWEWPQEMVNIKDAYPGFYDWLANPNDHTWFRTNPNRSNVTAR